jgi:hypothetical protein
MKKVHLNKWKVAPVALILMASQSMASAGGGNHGGSNGSHKLFSDWCNQVGSVLNNAKIDADMAINQDSNYDTAVSDLTQGMSDALDKKIEQTENKEDQISERDSLTFRLLDNGIKIAKALKEQDVSELEQATVLESYYELINRASASFDAKYYVGSTDDLAIDQARFVLSWFLKGFTKVTSQVDTGTITIPTLKGPSFFVLAAIVTEFAAKDLKHLEVVGRYDDVRETLLTLSTRISKYVHGDTGQLSNDNYGTDHIVVPEIRKAIDSLPARCNLESFFN